MASAELHKQIKNWKKLDNLIELKKFQYSNALNQAYWIGTLVLALIVLIAELTNQQKGVVMWGYLTVFILLGIGFIYLLIISSKGQKQANEDMDYLYHLKDEQKV